jgi:hypothetical protein
MDQFDPRLIWGVAFGIGSLSMLGYLWLHARAGDKITHRQNGNEKLEKESAVVAE